MSNHLIKICPVCGHQNDLADLSCIGEVDHNQVCGYSLFEVDPVVNPGSSSPPSPEPAPPPERKCLNGHELAAEDQICLVCGAEARSSVHPDPPPPPPERQCLNGHELAAEDQICLVCGAEPQSFDQPPPPPPPPPPPGPTLHDLLGSGQLAPDVLRGVLQELDAFLHRVQLQGRNYGDLRPDQIFVLSREPLRLEPAATEDAGNPTDINDLSAHIPTQTGLYTAPERLIGIEAPHSDWWSLGLLLLQAFVGPTFWEGVHEKAWLLQVITDGVVVPEIVAEPWSTLLTGLLTLDPQQRWAHEQVARWLDGEEDIPVDAGSRTQSKEGSIIRLAGTRYSSPSRYALAAAQADSWDAALEHLKQGELLTWLEENGLPVATLAEISRLAADETLEPDERLMLVLVLLNPNLPLCLRGEVIGAGTLTSNPERARGWLDGVLPIRLRRIERHLWLPDLAERRTAALELAKNLKLSLDAPRFDAAALIADRRRLERAWAERRKDWPAALHDGLASLISRSRPTDEHLILLLSAELSQFRSSADVLQEAQRLANSAGVTQWDESVARQWLSRSQREVTLALQDRLSDFVRCGHPELDAWADAFRSDHRILPEKGLVLLMIPSERWERPEGSEHWQRLLQFFRRRVLGGIQRGPLLALSVSPKGKRIDLADLVSNTLPAETLINHLVGRQPRSCTVDPALLEQNPSLSQRMRRLRQDADAYQRETGITALYLGYPLLVRKGIVGSPGATRKPTLLPLLLWPVRLGVAAHGTLPQLRYDKDRTGSEGIRINPALESVLAIHQVQALQEALGELHQRSALTGSQVMDVLRTVIPAAEGVLERCPQSPSLPPGSDEQLLPSGVLFLCSFSAQTLAHELEQLEKRPTLDGPMATLLRLSPTDSEQSPPHAELPEEHERFLVTPADPSQKRAVWASRQIPGVLIQGPPGTGKSQTIVNIVADALGRGDRVLVVCQKQAALEVVQNRLEAAGLGGRLCLITDPSSDRRSLLRKLREDLDSWDGDRRRELLTRERLAIAEEISRLERDLDALHRALAQPVANSGLDHRQIIDELLQLGKPDGVPSIVSLRALLHDRHIEEVRMLARQCANVGSLWLRAEPEDSPLNVLTAFSTDEGTIDTFTHALIKLREAENARMLHTSECPTVIESGTPDQLLEWLENHSRALRSADSNLLFQTVQWLPLFADRSGSDIELRLSRLDQEVKSISTPASSVKWQPYLCNLEDNVVDALLQSSENAETRHKFLATRLNSDFLTYEAIAKAGSEMAFALPRETARAEELSSLAKLETWLCEHYSSVAGIDPLVLSLVSSQETLSTQYWEKGRISLQILISAIKQSSPLPFSIEWNASSLNLSDVEISELLEATKIRMESMHSLSRVWNKSYMNAKARIKGIMPKALMTKDTGRISSLQQELRHELEMRQHRRDYALFCQQIGIELDVGCHSQNDLLRGAEGLDHKIQSLLDLLHIVSSCPSRVDIENVLLEGNVEALKSLFEPITLAAKREAICKHGSTILEGISPFCAADWLSSLVNVVKSGNTVISQLSETCSSCGDITSDYQDIQRLLTVLETENISSQIPSLIQALKHEADMRRIRQKTYLLLGDLGITPQIPVSTKNTEIIALVAHLQAQLLACRDIAEAISCCPQQQQIEEALQSGSPDYVETSIRQMENGLKRQVLRQECLQALELLSTWCSPEWIEGLGYRIDRNQSILSELDAIHSALPRLLSFQLFRKRATTLSDVEIAVLALLATVRSHWETLPEAQLVESIRITIEREALLGWQAYAEANEPCLLLSRDEMQSRTNRLEEQDNRLLDLNRKLTATPAAPERVQPRSRWDDIIMLQGPRARKLRELVELGEQRGLFELCPVWLANPETISQIFPLRQGLFDLVVFDEASQLPVENALPAIYRATRLVVSGDEKQLPPTRFFSSGFADDSEEDLNEDEVNDEPDLIAEAVASAETRRQVKDCSDLLELAKAAGLNHVSLDIHYRSRFRPLIAHSNTAFYQNKLSVPVLHPAEEICRIRPLQFEIVNGTYDSQSNLAEAEAVTMFLQELWCGAGSKDDDDLPTLGVVTFNKTQAELIEDQLDRLSQKDERFQEILERERQRRRNGEDCGFFVKNLENVQGDERDVILFSTTFGRDGSDRFRRSFGALGQKGGERRLNVATSRARDKMVIFCSMPLEEISNAHRQRRSPQEPRDFLQSYLLYASAISAGRLDEAQMLLERMHTSSLNRPASTPTRANRYFVQSVESYLRENGLEVEVPTASDAFAFDLAVRHPETGLFALGIECDPPRHADLLHARDREIWRPRVLKSTVPSVHRVWSRLWLLEADRERQRLSDAVRQALPSLSIAP
jgi:hypothetical protein